MHQPLGVYRDDAPADPRGMDVPSWQEVRAETRPGLADARFVVLDLERDRGQAPSKLGEATVPVRDIVLRLGEPERRTVATARGIGTSRRGGVALLDVALDDGFGVLHQMSLTVERGRSLGIRPRLGVTPALHRPLLFGQRAMAQRCSRLLGASELGPVHARSHLSCERLRRIVPVRARGGKRGAVGCELYDPRDRDGPESERHRGLKGEGETHVPEHRILRDDPAIVLDARLLPPRTRRHDPVDTRADRARYDRSGESPMSTPYTPTQPDRSDIDAMTGVIALEFGTDWCGYCRAAAPLIAAALSRYPDVRHLKVEDGSGRPLGRSFRVKLWPTLVVLKDGKECSRVVRPSDEDGVRAALDASA